MCFNLKYLLTLLITFQCTLLSAQQIIKSKGGDEIKGQVLGVLHGKLNYVPSDDPEFNTKTLEIPNKGIEVKTEKGEIKYFKYRPQHYISLSTGPAVATRDFGKMEIDNVYSGFADEGVATKLEAGFYFFRNFGLGLHLSNHHFEPRMDEASAYYNDNGGGFVYSEGDWNYNIILVGPLYSARISDKFSFQAHYFILGGGDITKPAWGYEHDPQVGNTVIYRSGTDFTSIDGLYDIGIAFSYQLSKRFQLKLSFDSFRSRTSFRYQVTRTNGNGDLETSSHHSTYYVSDFSTSIGIGYTFLRKEYKKL